jgi:hypothetical protein
MNRSKVYNPITQRMVFEDGRSGKSVIKFYGKERLCAIEKKIFGKREEKVKTSPTESFSEIKLPKTTYLKEVSAPVKVLSESERSQAFIDEIVNYYMKPGEVYSLQRKFMYQGYNETEFTKFIRDIAIDRMRNNKFKIDFHVMLFVGTTIFVDPWYTVCIDGLDEVVRENRKKNFKIKVAKMKSLRAIYEAMSPKELADEIAKFFKKIQGLEKIKNSDERMKIDMMKKVSFEKREQHRLFFIKESEEERLRFERFFKDANEPDSDNELDDEDRVPIPLYKDSLIEF